MKRNYLAPYLEKAAERYYAGGYAFQYVRYRLICAFQFVERLRIAHVQPDQVTMAHVGKFQRWYVAQSPKKALWRRAAACAAARSVLRQIWAEHPPIVTRSPSQVEVDRYVDHLRHNRGLSMATMRLHRHYLERFLTSCFQLRPVDPSAITVNCVHA